ncbi:MAG TPA: aminotransferase class III-fold pyridoxal phosphate-dependent enzyme [Thermomicrobiales bacterium]|nr:aminotransferase class III-fold pyridoxal phosphate-dependent enzyme [Thermomicrobiales bacterium]
MATPVRTERIDEARARRMAGSAALHARARGVFPDGVTHDNRYMEPFSLYCTHAAGPRKWDVDGNEYIDYFGGHGALLLGHAHPAIVEALTRQAGRGTHLGACHEQEVRWGEQVQELVPSARGGLVKFTSSGTEATMMALRLARAFTGKEVICKQQGGFHGWHDYAVMAMQPPYDEPVSVGIPRGVRESVVSIPAGDVEALRALLDARDDIAGLILIADGAGTSYLQAVRDLTAERGVVLIFDEVVTGFRYAPGGAQEYYGVTPDLTTLAKILAGGLNGGAITGRADIMGLFLQRDDPEWQRHGRIPHQGTFNANPLSAAAGVACLDIVKDPAYQRRAKATADQLRAGFNEMLARRGVAGRAGGESSLVGLRFDEPKVGRRQLVYRVRAALQLGGVDPSGLSFIVSAVHGQPEVDQTVAAFDDALAMLQEEGTL